MQHGAAVERHADGGGGVKEGKSDEHGKVPHCDSGKDLDETGVTSLLTSNQRTDYVLHKPPNDLANSSDCERNKASWETTRGAGFVWLTFGELKAVEPLL